MSKLMSKRIEEKMDKGIGEMMDRRMDKSKDKNIGEDGRDDE